MRNKLDLVSEAVDVTMSGVRRDLEVGWGTRREEILVLGWVGSS